MEGDGCEVGFHVESRYVISGGLFLSEHGLETYVPLEIVNGRLEVSQGSGLSDSEVQI